MTQSPARQLDLSAATLIMRLERLPITSWHVRARMIVGAATFFDAFDVLTISIALPVLAVEWHLNPGEIGALISTGFIGQLAGALFFGWIAEKFGRMPAMVYSVALLSVTSLACAAAWDYNSLFLFRTIQGIGIGGEVPVAATYINELSRAKRRGRFFLLYEIAFGIGLTSAALIGYWAVPRLGWQAMFIFGSMPALLALKLRRLLPESPRWLAAKGRLDEADRILRQMESHALRQGMELEPIDSIDVEVSSPSSAPSKNVTRWRELFSRQYRKRTLSVWAIWFACYFVSYGLTTWLPTIYRTIFKFDVATALRFALATNLAGLAGDLLVAFQIDRIGRRLWLSMAFALAALPLAALWFVGTGSAVIVAACASVSYVFVASNSVACYLYTPEIYPTRLRAFGSSIATAWLRIGSAVGPGLVALMLTQFDLRAVFMMFALVSLAGAVIAGAFAVETSERILEEVSP